MSGVMKSVLAGGICIALTACAGLQLEKAQRVTPTGSDFDRALYDGYIDLSSAEFAEGDYGDSDFFALRAIDAAGGNPVDPDTLGNRNLPQDGVTELGPARQRLVSALAATASGKAPQQAARAQVMFDCWMQEKEENFQPEDIAACRDAYLQIIEEVEVAVVPVAQPAPQPAARPAPTPAPAPAPAPAPVPRAYLVFFDFDDSSLRPEAQQIVGTAANNADTGEIRRISVVGHADRSGTDAYNDRLSLRRAETVRDALIALGYPAAQINVAARGEADPLVPTPDGVREPQNRRVEINFQ